MASYQQLLGSLVDSVDPPVPQLTTSLARPVGPARRKHVVQMAVLTTFFLVVPAALLLYYQHWIIGGIFALFSVLMIKESFTSDVWVAACPYCAAVFETTQGLNPAKEGKIVQCKNCWEYSIYSGGRVRAHDPNSISEVPSFLSPVFEGGVWPKGCVACGEPPTRLDEVKARDVSYGMLAMGRLWVTSGKASGIPYCDRHKDAVSLKFDSQKRLQLEWCSLRMMRRYLAANNKLGRKPSGRKWI
jgi:hypothetical protein